MTLAHWEAESRCAHVLPLTSGQAGSSERASEEGFWPGLALLYAHSVSASPRMLPCASLSLPEPDFQVNLPARMLF